MFESAFQPEKEKKILRLTVSKEVFDKMKTLEEKHGVHVIVQANENEPYVYREELLPGDDVREYDRLDIGEDGTQIGITHNIVPEGNVYVAIEHDKKDLGDYWDDVGIFKDTL